jgi:hypothetical protein
VKERTNVAKLRVFIFEDNWICKEAIVSVIGKDEGIDVIRDTEDQRISMKGLIIGH